MVNRGRELPGGSVDLVVTAMEDQVLHHDVLFYHPRVNKKPLF